jgi:hypothetical protein
VAAGLGEQFLAAGDDAGLVGPGLLDVGEDSV